MTDATYAKADLDEMWDVAAAIAHDIETSQSALVIAGLRSAPHPRAVRQVAALEQICRLIEAVREVEDELRAAIIRQRKRVPR